MEATTAITSATQTPSRTGAGGRWVVRGFFLAWVVVTGWTVSEVVRTRLSRSDNSWAVLGVGAVLVLMVLTACTAASLPRGAFGRRTLIATFGVSVMLVGSVIWAVRAPLPQLEGVAMPPENASAQQVVRAFVLAIDEHDHATAKGLCGHGAPPCGALDEDVHVAIAQIGSAYKTTDSLAPARVAVVSVPVMLTGQTRSGGQPGEAGNWEYIVARVGPSGAWRIIDDGMG